MPDSNRIAIMETSRTRQTEMTHVAAEPAGPSFAFNRMEWAGAFGDLGTLIPFVVAYVTLLRLEPAGILVSFGAALIATAIVFRTPFPVQPMKAIGAIATTQAAQTATVTAGAVYSASLFTGLIWLALGMTGAAQRIAKLVPRPVTVGLILGLGFGFMIQGLKFMAEQWLLALPALVVTLLLLNSRRFPAMFVLLLIAIAAGLASAPERVGELAGLSLGFQAPPFALGGVTAQEMLIGLVFLALPQVPLTLGNAIIAIKEESNRLFPDRPVTERQIAVSTGVMNCAGAMIGAVPMCHGAGGLAGHVRFGAKTAGSTLILGALLLLAGLFAAQAVVVLFSLFSSSVLGVMLFLTGAQLALGSCDLGRRKEDRFVTLIAAAATIWNVGIGFALGVALHWGFRKGWFKL